ATKTRSRCVGEMYSPRNRSSVSGSAVRRRATAARTRASTSSSRRSTWITEGSAAVVSGGAAIDLRAIDAADAQDAAGLFLFPGADQFLLVGRHARLVSGLAQLEPSPSLRPAGSRGAHRLGGLGGCGRAPAPHRARSGPDRLIRLAVRSGHDELRLFQHGRPG